MKFSYAMPFGVELSDEGTAHFRLWAPAASEVEVCALPRKVTSRLPALTSLPSGPTSVSISPVREPELAAAVDRVDDCGVGVPAGPLAGVGVAFAG